MNRAINKFPYLELRLFIAIIVSCTMIIADGKFNFIRPFKEYIEDSVYFFYCLCYKPIYIFEYVSKIFSGYTTLILENDALRKELFLKNSELLLLDHYKQENYKLHNLLNSTICKTRFTLVTKIFFIKTNHCNEQAIINQGINNGVYVGQPVISDVGVVGQIVSVTKTSSRILLISDHSHALSVKLKRNNSSRIILIGNGPHADLYAEYSGNIDIRIDDILVTSGLDDRFPEGYPVAIVSNIKNDLETDLTIIQATPIVKLQCLRYVVLVWN